MVMNDSGQWHNWTSQEGGQEEEECTVQHILYTTPAMVIFSILYAIIFCCGTLGNLLVSAAVIRSQQMHTVTNFFILNLAISDVVMCLFSVPFTPLQSFNGQWFFGEAMCKLFPFSQGVSVYISTLTLTIIAIDRFVIIIYPYRARMQIKTCIVLIILIDLMAAAFTAPYVFHVGLHPATAESSNGSSSSSSSNVTGEEVGEKLICMETWSGLRRTLYGAFTNITQFVLPFTTVIFCYSAIIRKLSERSSLRPGRRSAAREEAERARTLRTNRMLISMVVVFGICWLPLNTINFLADLDLFPIYCWEYHNFAFFICHVLAMSSTCYNPFLYGAHNESFQREFVKMLPILRGICGSGDPRSSLERGDSMSRAGLTTMAQSADRADRAAGGSAFFLRKLSPVSLKRKCRHQRSMPLELSAEAKLDSTTLVLTAPEASMKAPEATTTVGLNGLSLAEADADLMVTNHV